MIHEYALEPELVATWGNRHDFRYFVEKFGLGQPRIVSRYPRPWKRLVWDAFHGDDDLERSRMVELLQRIGEQMVHRRDYVWNAVHQWRENAQAENQRIPFHAILARENPGGHPSILVPAALAASPLWATSRGITIARNAGSMAAAVAAMLRIARVIVFVDPHFSPAELRFRRPLEVFLQAVLQARPIEGPGRVEVHTSMEHTGTREFFEGECQRRLQRCIPRGMNLRIVRLQERLDGEHLHNR
ncbi:MAG: hypothetical protein L0191_18160, partial [Acidobacteria bacterium]|nr:hypothetical protein [Acidobacteriota bacterium]